MNRIAPRKQPYPDLPASPDFPAIEQEVLDFWEREGIFKATIENRPDEDAGGREFVFYDGPPFANGLPHYGHLVTGYVKDVVPRYRTMRGYRVERRFGWDCHGLPAEMGAEKELGISGRDKIIQYGIERFNSHCRTSVLRYTKEWETTVTRQGRWVDFRNDYKTMDLSYMESVLWAFKTLHDKGLIYEGVRVLPYSWAAETPVSNFETRLDDSYRERTDPALTVGLTVTDGPELLRGAHLLVWTTTPWTLPSNLAAAVGPDMDYGVYELEGRRYVLGKGAFARYERELKQAKELARFKGRDLVGLSYEPLFPFFKDTPGAFRVFAADFVTDEDGTGVVHLAPGFGEDDFAVCEQAGLPVVCPVDDRGAFTDEAPDFAGLNVFEANKPIIRALKDRGLVLRHEQYVHNYPHCWRTDEPLIYKAMSSWFLKVSAFRERMVELNREITWIPEHIKDGVFGNWLANAKDWSISRRRFWGTPIPVWQSDDPRYPRIDVYGGLDELERDFGVRPDDLHRPAIDELTRPNPDDPTGKSTMRRVADVFDCWFESGSMPYAQVHYPFENQEWFEKHFPADFIVEYVAQTRGWFYTLMVLATALFDRPPFKNCICHGVVLDENGQKLSKRLQNYPPPEQVFASHGADALRWFLVSSPILRGGNLLIDREGGEIGMGARQVLLPLWNACHFFCMYANAESVTAKADTSSNHVLDRYLLAKTRALVEGLSARMDSFDIVGACALVPPFMEALNNWYIRRSRARFWSRLEGGDQRAAYDTLYTVLTTLLKALAPLLPFAAEHLYRSLTGERSVHLADWPDVSTFPREEALIAEIDLVRDACSAAKSVRETHRLRTRLPLRRLTIAGRGVERLEPFAALIKDEVNVKEVRLGGAVEDYADFVLYVHTPMVGKRLRGALKDVLAAAREGKWTRRDDGGVEVAGQVLAGGEYDIRLTMKEGVSGEALPGNSAVAVLDVTVDEDLAREGLARDFIRQVQSVRKERDLDISDRIRLIFGTDSPEVAAAIEAHADFIREQVLAESISHSAPPPDAAAAEVGEAEVRIALTKV